jgi:hypothetical protein
MGEVIRVGHCVRCPCCPTPDRASVVPGAPYYNLSSLSFVRLVNGRLYVSAARRQRSERQIGIYHLASPGGWWRRSSRRLSGWGERSHVRVTTTSSPAQSARRHSTTPSTTPSAREQGRLSHLSLSRRRAGAGPPPLRRCTISTSSSPSICATRVCRRTCCWASSRRTSRSHYAGARLPK